MPFASALADPGLPCAHARECPISKSPCPGECVYAEVLGSINVGILVFDISQGSLLFKNTIASEMLDAFGILSTYESLAKTFLPPPGAIDHGGYRPPPLKVGRRLLGYSAYQAKSFVWLFLRDITEKLRLESIAESVEFMNNIGYVFSAVRHELGNPINSVSAAVSLLRANLENYPRELVANYLDHIAVELDRVGGLLRQLKSFSLYEAVNIEEVLVVPFVSSFVGLFTADLRSGGITVLADVTGAPRAGLFDPRALHQVLLNLLTNAADALGGVAQPMIRLTASSADGFVTFRIEDNGCGIPPEHVCHMFKPFYTTKEHGTGLGLVICKKMLTKMNGTITVESKVGAGSSFTITLPEAPGGRA